VLTIPARKWGREIGKSKIFRENQPPPLTDCTYSHGENVVHMRF
jgi:hypothetical protein